MLPRKFRYWPPSHKGACQLLPSGRKCSFVHLKRNDTDGTRWEAVFSIATRKGSNRLVTFDREEFSEFRKVVDRLNSIGGLWKTKLSPPASSSCIPDPQMYKE